MNNSAMKQATLMGAFTTLILVILFGAEQGCAPKSNQTVKSAEDLVVSKETALLDGHWAFSPNAELQSGKASSDNGSGHLFILRKDRMVKEDFTRTVFIEVNPGESKQVLCRLRMSGSNLSIAKKVQSEGKLKYELNLKLDEISLAHHARTAPNMVLCQKYVEISNEKISKGENRLSLTLQVNDDPKTHEVSLDLEGLEGGAFKKEETRLNDSQEICPNLNGSFATQDEVQIGKEHWYGHKTCAKFSYTERLRGSPALETVYDANGNWKIIDTSNSHTLSQRVIFSESLLEIDLLDKTAADELITRRILELNEWEDLVEQRITIKNGEEPVYSKKIVYYRQSFQ